MPLIDAQRRLHRTGAIRLGNKVLTGGTDRRGNPRMRPNKLNTFRITSPHRHVIDAIAQRFGGTVERWQGHRGPEFEAITLVAELHVLVPAQLVDPNYEYWGGRNLLARRCDGETERLRGQPCLCQQWNNHEHTWRKGKCTICNLSQDWDGSPHQHDYDMGECVICGCRRPCKPTTRINVMIQGIPEAGVFKVESHGFNAAVELPALSEMIASAPVPLPAILGMRYEERTKLVFKHGQETIETYKFHVPELRFPWIFPELLFAGSLQLEQAARAQLVSQPQQQAIGATQETPADRIIAEARKCTQLSQVQDIWKRAVRDDIMDQHLADELTTIGNVLMKSSPATQGDPDVVDAEIINEPWPETTQPGSDTK